MKKDIKDFVEVLRQAVQNTIDTEGDITYTTLVIRIIDARNHIIRLEQGGQTDDALDIYSLTDLCYVDEELVTRPNILKLERIAESYWR